MKLPLHFSTYRSGSVPVAISLEAYFERHSGLVGLGDFFEPDPEVLARNAPRERLPRGYLQKTYAGRVNFIKRNVGNYFFTIYPGHRADFLDWLGMHFEFIFSERRNLVQQMLSHLLSEATNEWYREGGLSFEPKSVTARLEDFRFFERHVFGYYQLKARLRPKKVITFESFCEHGPEATLRSIGLRGAFSSESLSIPQKQNPGRKDKIFTNTPEIRKWYESSFVQDLCPWREGISLP